MVKIMFVCHGNICRSPMAEYLFKDLVAKQGLEASFLISSSATSGEEIGNPVYYATRNILNGLNIDCQAKRAQQFTKKDYNNYDFIIVMDEKNKRNLMRIVGFDDSCKIFKLLDFGSNGQDIADPWYTRDFTTTYNEIMTGLRGLFKYLKEIGKC